MILWRKLTTFGVILRECTNWLAVTLGSLGFEDVSEIRLRNGLILSLQLPPREKAKDGFGTNVKPIPGMRYWGEVLEPAVADCYGIRKVSPDLIVDVGMNIGSFSSLAAKTHPEAEVYAFEPNPAAIEMANINFERNGLHKVHVIPSPLTADGRDVTLVVPPERGAYSVVQKVKSVTLTEVPFHLATDVFVKLDCEGAEGELIEWLVENNEQLPKRVKIMCEYHHWCPQPLEDLVAKLKSVGFDDARVTSLFDETYIEASRR